MGFQRLLAKESRSGGALYYGSREGTAAVGAVGPLECCGELTIPQALLSSSSDAAHCEWAIASPLCDGLPLPNGNLRALSEEIAAYQVAPRTGVNQ